jgi:hypothetical protein
VFFPSGSNDETVSKGESNFVAAAAKFLSGSDVLWNINEPGANARLTSENSCNYYAILALVKNTGEEPFPWKSDRRSTMSAASSKTDIRIVCKLCWGIRFASAESNGNLTNKRWQYVCSSKHAVDALEGFASIDCGTHKNWKEYDPVENPNPMKGYRTHKFVRNRLQAKCMYQGCMKLSKMWCSDQGCQRKEFQMARGPHRIHSRHGFYFCPNHRSFYFKSVQLAETNPSHTPSTENTRGVK